MYKKHMRRYVNRTKKIVNLSKVIKRVLCGKWKNGKYRRQAIFLKNTDLMRSWEDLVASFPRNKSHI